MFFMLYNYSLCWKIKKCGQGEESAFKVNLSTVATCIVAGVMWWSYSAYTGFLSDEMELKMYFRSTVGNSNCKWEFCS